MAIPIRKLTQTGYFHDQPDLETVRDRLPIFTADEPEQIVDAFEAGLNSLSQPSSPVSVQQAAQTLVSEIKIILPLAANKNEHAFFLGKLCSLFMRIAQQVPSRHIGQELLVHTVKLIQISPEEAWRDGWPSALGMKMRDGWIGFTTEDGHNEDEVLTPDEWLNLNSYCARLFGTTRWYNFAIWQLREGLETKLGPNSHENDCKIAVASEWIIQAGPELLVETLLNEDISEAEKRAYCGHELWTGMPGLSTERWGFWKRRLGEVKPSVKSRPALAYLENAERVMTAVEKDLASSMS
ncbi:hypothetical protein KVR01_012491 [Diaporthe batatas]|uniref:uncharacterized protein n=1 Tax=Diaporthe batatas TaxID=748121 RepID=UPI001D04B2A0|nr:uncharacterized protein KVR01_012491 [Diaporthe batatas]KAG8157829.1 hypothetical protein KVR01_012491 [Diaporthe batatas]